MPRSKNDGEEIRHHDDSGVPARQPVLAAELPLYAFLFSVHLGGHRQIRPVQRIMAWAKANLPVSPISCRGA